MPLAIGSRRELFVDHELIAALRGAELRLASPVDAGPAIEFDQPWEGAFCGYSTVIHDGGLFRLYYRGVPAAGQDGNQGEVTCYAESRDGRRFTRPDLGLFDVLGTKRNNVILANHAPLSHNFSPMLDTRPGVPASERFKALAGTHRSGLVAFVSGDGVRWRKLRDEPVLSPQQSISHLRNITPKTFALDSQNLAFWSGHEGKYVLYYRTWREIGGTRYRWVSRATSPDFVTWSELAEMEYGDAPPEHLYTNQTSPYFRAPHIYTGICARFLPGRRVLSEEQAAALRVDPGYYKDCSDAVLVTSRGGARYTRTFLDAFLRPGVGLENWVSRSNYPALNLVQTGPATMSFYVNRNYGQPTAYLRRYDLRLDGLIAVHAGYAGGELQTKPLTFEGSRLELNFSTSAAGGIRVEMQDQDGRPLPGLALSEAPEAIGDEVARVYRDVGALRGKPVRLRFVLKDADLYSFRFA
ncbi:MAG: hypothetical protein IPM24_11120 [Bryobacterales bacterium]|nr:hypothetical protein [Bryobacterales bacterium]